ncbi:MAG TPA: DNA-3-methyladenine glycosylase 2 family protein [Acidobacteriota bacterium]|nr:DNA-3-methyladenine glycosylase 2 family protein [Acidobacteriota bacterium]
MDSVIAEIGPCRLDRYWRRQALGALFQTIIGQQISVQAARSIHRRFRALYGGRDPSARRLLSTSDDDLRAVGLSRSKVAYLRDLARLVSRRRLSLPALERLPDEEVIDALVQVKGIGRWTAEVFMIFRLGRLDMLPVEDIGLLDGAQVLYGLSQRPHEYELREISSPWRPYRSVGCWFLWQGRRRARGMELR